MRHAIYIGNAHIGSALPNDIALCAHLPPLSNLSGAQYLVLPRDPMQCNALLSQWAQELRRAGRLKTWRNELLPVSALPEPNAVLQQLPQALARLERGAARVLGILTHAVHVVGFAPNTGTSTNANASTHEQTNRSQPNVWIQQRALNKASDPGLWDTLSGGLLSAGDSLLSGALRETYEEAGLTPSDLLHLKSCGMVQQNRMVADGHILEAVWTFTATVTPEATPHNLDGEVMGFKCVSPSELTTLAQTGQLTQEAVLAFRMAGAL